ncbi:MAG: DUF1232 domain-containing protein [Deltaproteobacteria bacterium]|nr:DUF1232 domain-containing protein [Deltaproteobacteria bacterium]
MNTTALRAQIADALKQERRNPRARALLQGISRPAPLSDLDLRRAEAFAEAYVARVPELVDEALGRAAGTFAEPKLRRMLEVALAYWEEEEDVIPDSLGLLGVLDDAYATLALVQALSLRYREETGHALVSEDVGVGNSAARALLGEELSDRLDAFVDDALADRALQELLAELVEEPLAPPPPPVWEVDALAFLLAGSDRG